MSLGTFCPVARKERGNPRAMGSHRAVPAQRVSSSLVTIALERGIVSRVFSTEAWMSLSLEVPEMAM
jgi:hypothetical protein